MAKLGDLVVRIGANTKDLNKGLGRVQRNLRNMTNNITALGTSMTRSITVPLVGVGAAALKSAADLETLETSFISLTGGAEQAADMMQQLNAFTAKTPFQIDAVAKSARQLIASGTDVDQVNEQLQFLGDIAATSGSSIDEIAAIFSKVNAKGKVELENLNQLAERGIPVFKALSDATGLPADKLGAGAVSVETFNETLKSFAAEGGFASGAMLRLSNTVAGKFSTALDNAKLAAASLGQELLPMAKKALDRFTALAQKFTTLDEGTKRIALAVGALAASFGPLLLIIPKIVSALTLLTGPIGITILAIGAIVTAFVMLYDDLRPLITEVANLFIEMYNNIVPLRIIIAVVQTVFVNAGKAIYTAFFAVVDIFRTLASSLTKLLQGDFSGAWDTLKDGLVAAGEDVFQTATEIGSDVIDAVNEAIYAEKIDLLGPDALPTKAEIMDRFNSLFAGSGQAIDDAVGESSEVASSKVNGLLRNLTSVETKADKVSEKFVDMADVIKQALGGIANAFDGTGNFLSKGLTLLGDLMVNIGNQMVALATSMLKFRKFLISNPALAIVAGTGFIIAGQALSNIAQRQIEAPALANGGVAFGPTMALIGDNKNASIDPEVVAPLSKLRDIMGGNQVEVYGRISGNDIYLSNNRAGTSRNRYA